MNKFAKSWLLVATLCFSPLVLAAPAKGLYSAEVQVDDQGESAREQALEKALERVLVRVTGDPEVAFTADGRTVLARARQLVQQFGYKRVAKPEEDTDTADPEQVAEQLEASDKPATELRLQVRFNGGAVNNALREAGLPVWGSERPKTMLWLARGGSSPVLITGKTADAARSVARERGVPVVLPGEDAEDRRRASADDVIAGYNDRLRSVSRGYGASHLLIAKILDSGGLWSADWSLMQGDSTLESWENSANTQSELIAEGMRRAADVFAARYAVTARGGSNVVTLAVDRLTSVQDFARVSEYLGQLTAVDGFMPALVTQDYAIFSVVLSGDADVLERSISLSELLVQDDSARDLAGLHAAGQAALGYTLAP